MAYDYSQLFPSASPLATAGVDPDEAIASGDPTAYLAAKRAGLDYQPQQVAQNDPPPSPQMRIPITPWSGRGTPVPANNGQPADNDPNPPSEATVAPADPATVTPSGSAQPPASGNAAFSQMARQALQRQMTALTGQGNGNPAIADLEAKRSAAVAAAPNPNDPAFKPTIGSRFQRGLRGFARAGIGGVIDPTIGGGEAYGAPSGDFKNQQTKNQSTLADIDQKIGQANSDQANNLKLAEGFGRVGTEAAKQQDSQTKQDKITQQAADKGLKINRDADGNIVSIDDDTESTFYKKRKAEIELKGAQETLAEATAAAKNADPSTPAGRIAIMRAETAKKIADAATINAHARILNATAGNLGTTPEGAQIEGSASTATGKPVGSKFSGAYVRNQGNVAQFNDVLGATDNIESTAKSLVAKHGKGALADPIIAAGIAEPEGTAGKWMQGQVSAGNMTPEQRDYVTNLRAYRENLQALRKSAGGGVSDSQVDRLMEMAPGAATPDIDYLMRQTKQIRQTAGRLSEGQPNFKGGHQVRTNAHAPEDGPATAPPAHAPEAVKGLKVNDPVTVKGRAGVVTGFNPTTGKAIVKFGDAK